MKSAFQAHADFIRLGGRKSRLLINDNEGGKVEKLTLRVTDVVVRQAKMK